MSDRRESGVVPAGDSRAEVLRGCTEIVSAVSIVLINLDFAAAKVNPEVREAMEDAKQALDRIVEIANTIRTIQRAVPDSERGATREHR